MTRNLYRSPRPHFFRYRLPLQIEQRQSRRQRKCPASARPLRDYLDGWGPACEWQWRIVPNSPLTVRRFSPAFNRVRANMDRNRIRSTTP